MLTPELQGKLVFVCGYLWVCSFVLVKVLGRVGERSEKKRRGKIKRRMSRKGEKEEERGYRDRRIKHGERRRREGQWWLGRKGKEEEVGEEGEGEGEGEKGERAELKRSKLRSFLKSPPLLDSSILIPAPPHSRTSSLTARSSGPFPAGKCYDLLKCCGNSRSPAWPPGQPMMTSLPFFTFGTAGAAHAHASPSWYRWIHSVHQAALEAWG